MVVVVEADNGWKCVRPCGQGLKGLRRVEMCWLISVPCERLALNVSEWKLRREKRKLGWCRHINFTLEFRQCRRLEVQLACCCSSWSATFSSGPLNQSKLTKATSAKKVIHAAACADDSRWIRSTNHPCSWNPWHSVCRLCFAILNSFRSSVTKARRV